MDKVSQCPRPALSQQPFPRGQKGGVWPVGASRLLPGQKGLKPLWVVFAGPLDLASLPVGASCLPRSFTRLLRIQDEAAAEQRLLESLEQRGYSAVELAAVLELYDAIQAASHFGVDKAELARQFQHYEEAGVECAKLLQVGADEEDQMEPGAGSCSKASTANSRHPLPSRRTCWNWSRCWKPGGTPYGWWPGSARDPGCCIPCLPRRTLAARVSEAEASPGTLRSRTESWKGSPPPPPCWQHGSQPGRG